MSDVKTSWILDIVDKSSKSLKKIMGKSDDAAKSIDKMTNSVKLNERDTKEALGKAQKHYKDLEKSVKEVENELKQLEKVKKNGNWSEQMEASRAYDIAKIKLERYRTALKGAEADVNDLSEATDKHAKKSKHWTDLATGINQGVELIQKATDGLDFAVDVKNLETEIKRFSDASGDELDKFVSKSRNIAGVYDQDAIEIAKSANAMTKQVGGSFESNLALIEEGFKKGANTNGDFLNSLKEYQPFIKQLGLSQAQAIAIIAKSGKEGIFSDKAIDSIKEADLSLREMGQAQVDALSGIGMKPEDLIGKTTFESIQLIASRMKGATAQAKQLILADIFKGAGEDAGLQWTQELATMDLDLTKLPSVEQAGAGIKGWFADIGTWAGQTFGNVAIYAQQLSPMVQMVAGAIPIWQSLSKVQWLQTAATNAGTFATRLFSATLMGTPIGWIILGVSALIGVITYCWEKFEGFREVIFKGWEALKLFGTVLKNFVTDRLKSLLQGLTGVGKALSHLFNGEWSEAWETGKQAGSDLLGLDAGKRAANSFKEGWSGAMSDGKLASDKYTADKKSQEKQTELPGVNSLLQSEPDKLGKANSNKSKKAKEGDGLNVGSGSNGIKSITMTLNIANNFSVSKDTNMRAIADQITGLINDRLRDSVINLGG